MKRLGKVRKWLIALSPSDAAGLTFSREFNPRGVKRRKILDNAYVDPRHTDRENSSQDACAFLFYSNAGGMAVARPYGFEIDFVRNPISGSAA